MGSPGDMYVSRIPQEVWFQAMGRSEGRRGVAGAQEVVTPSPEGFGSLFSPGGG